MIVMDTLRYLSTGAHEMSAHDIEKSPDPDIASSFGAMRRAGLRASALARTKGRKLAVWRDGKVVLMTPDEFEGKVSVVREKPKKYGKSEK